MALLIYGTTIQESNRHLKLAITSFQDTSSEVLYPNGISCVFAVGHFAQVRFKVKHAINRFTFSCSFKIHNLQKDSNIQINVTSNLNDHAKHLICPFEWSDFTEIGHARVNYTSSRSYCAASAIIDIIVNLNTSIPSPWATMHNDDKFVDFHLSSENGSVPVHRVVMAVHSEVFKTMLCGEWKETKKESLEVKGATKETLQHLKDYMYLGSLPEQHEDLRPLLLLAKCYMMQRLVEACSDKLAQTVTPENFQDILEFAVNQRLCALISAIFRNTPVKVVEASEVLNKEPKLKAAEE